MRKDNITKIYILRQLRQMNIKITLITKRLIRRLLPRLMSYKRRPGMSGAGFVLPTVTMVMLVVLLLTVAISLRSFNRVEDARNVRVNQAVLSAAAPALDRAKAKLEELLVTNPPTTGTPNEETLELALEGNKFNFGDETRLTVSYDIDNNSNIEDNEQIQTAWRFDVDTDGDGTDDGYTIYGIFFKTPDGDEARNPLEARVPPQSSENGNNNDCPGVLATSKEWIPIDTKLKKSFFVYAVTVQNNNQSGVSALEYQQDWGRTPLTNNAVIYEDDLEISPGLEFNLNGRIFANSNLIIAPTGNDPVNLRLVSSPASCFYSEADNSKIFVGGNMIYGLISGNPPNSGTVTIDLMNGTSTTPNTQTFTDDVDSTSTEAQLAAYDSGAYRERLDALVATASGLTYDQLPREVQDKISEGDDRDDALETYFRKLTRKVPNAETGCLDGSCITGIDGTGDELRPQDTQQNTLVLPDDTTTGVTLLEDNLAITDPPPEDETIQEQLGDRIEVGNNLPQQSWNGETLDTATMERGRTRTSQVETIADVGSTDRDGFWEQSAAEAPENASDGIGGLRVITGAGIYANDAAGTAYPRTRSFLPPPPAPPNMTSLGTGDYQVVWPDTMPMSPVEGSIIYDYNDADSNPNTIWREYDPTTYPTDSDVKGDLQMRATVLYHYASDTGENPQDSNSNTLEPQEPIACISSYYDPSTAITAQNTGTGSKSNNGIVYPTPTSTITSERAELDIQSKLVFPDGRLVNEPLKVALEHYDEPGRPNFTIADEAAIDAELCAIDIVDGTITASNVITGLNEGDIREVSFLDARQVKALDIDYPDTVIDETFTVNALIDGVRGYLADDSATTTVDESVVRFEDRDITTGEIVDQRLSLEERQPLEIRVTQLNLDALRQATLSQTVAGGPSEGGNEYLLPMSGIIYASRNDALPDRTHPDSTYDNLRTSPDDFDLDPSRRPNGFMLINGDRLARGTDGKSYNTLNSIIQEKGLLFISNNPVYIQGNFNRHEEEEFTERLADLGWGAFYTRATKEDNFACRRDDPRSDVNCTQGDPWRAATVLADAITLLSDNWETGYRNQGDFDLRNNGGNGIVGSTANPVTMREKRQFNGFFNNNYATNGLSSGATIAIDATPVNDVTLTDASYTGSNGQNSSYFNNFVTPVQRRINRFPEYVMEVCPKLPVSACEPNDWVVGEINPTNGAMVGTLDPDDPATRTIFSLFSSGFYTNGALNDNTDFETDNIISTGTNLVNTLASGTTARTPDVVQRFPRRVAFLRNEYGELELDDDRRPIPVGVQNNNTIQAYPYGRTATPVLPRTDQNNVLWFRTTTNNSPGGGTTYVANEPLFYLDYDGSDRDNSGNKLPLPPTPKIDGENDSLIAADDTRSPYRDALCNHGGRRSRIYYLLNEAKYADALADSTIDETRYYPVSNGDCTSEARNVIENLRTELMALSEDTDIEEPGMSTLIRESTDGGTTYNFLRGDSITDTSNPPDGRVVYEIPGNIASGVILQLEGDSDDVFVLKSPSDIIFGTDGSPGVELELLGAVNPNNIFWVSAAGMTFADATAADPHILAGNFIGNTVDSINIGENTKVLGGRFLGFNGFRQADGTTNIAPSSGSIDIPTGVDIRAMTNQANPSLVPVLQIHEPDATAGAATLNGGNAASDTGWMVEAQDTTFNLVVGSGDTPARADQGNGGLQNLVRFQENWEFPEKTTNIFGAFIQLERSKYATAPQQQIIQADVNRNPALLSDLFSYRLRYESGAADGILGFQAPPARNWGYDVGILSQPPDLFALRFTLPPTDEPDEFFREVGIDDDWVRGLLCSKDEDGNNAIERPDSGESGYYCGDYE